MTRLALSLAVSLAAGAGAKPLNPFQGDPSRRRTSARAWGAEVTLVLTLKPIESFPAADVELRLPKGAVLVTGQRRVTVTPVAEGSERVLEWRVKVREPGQQEIWVAVRALGIEPSAAGRAFRCVVNPDPPPPPPPVRHSPEGTEYRVHEIPLQR